MKASYSKEMEHTTSLGLALLMQVLCINDEHLDSPIMFVWDGTDALPLPLT